MARVFVNDSTLTDIADAIREKNGTEDTYKPSQMADAVRAIESGSSGVVNIIEAENPDRSMLWSFTQLGPISFPNATEIGYEAFHSCYALTSIDLPLVTSIGEGAFQKCTSLNTIDIPSVTSIGSGAFSGCTSLTSVDLPLVTSIGDDAFYVCSNLSTLILRTTETVCEIGLTALLNTKIMTEEGLPTGEGFVYIPTAMEPYYRAGYEPVFEELGAAGLFDLLFRKIEDYPEICG